MAAQVTALPSLCVELGVGSRRLDFTQFYRRSKDECLFTVMVSVGEEDLARELVAEAFARAWASWRKVCEHPAPTAWVVRTALNAGISRWRRSRREVTVADPSLLADPPMVTEESSDLDPLIVAALKRLPARQRQVLALRLILDLDIARTAEVLDIAPGTVQAHQGRAIATLREDLTLKPLEECLS